MQQSYKSQAIFFLSMHIQLAGICGVAKTSWCEWTFSVNRLENTRDFVACVFSSCCYRRYFSLYFQQHPNSNLQRCPFNYCHLIKPEAMRYHMLEECPNNDVVEKEFLARGTCLSEEPTSLKLYFIFSNIGTWSWSIARATMTTWLKLGKWISTCWKSAPIVA